MSKRFILIFVLVLSLACTASAGIVYVDATDGEAGNTTLATGEIFTPVDVGSGGSGADGLWRVRGGFSNGGTIYETRGDWAGNNTEDCPRLATTVSVPEGDYSVYAYMWTAGTAQWRVRASLEDSAGELPLYLCYDPNGEAILAVAEDFEEPVPLVTEADRTLWQVYLGTTGTTTVITVYVDDDADSDPADGGNSRTWYDGIGYEPAPPKIVYVDATDGEAGNTTLATGEIFTPVDVGTGGSGADGLWRIRAFANSGTIYESGGSWEADLNTEDCPRLMTSVEVSEGNYDVYVYFWADAAQWRIQASLENSEGDLPLYLANDPNSEATMAVAEDFEEPVPMLTEGNRTLWQVYLGTTGVTSAITVFIDDEAAHMTGNSRTWYDGIGYASTPPVYSVSLGAAGDITLDNGPRYGQDGSGNGSGLEARDIPDRRHVFMLSYDISALKGRGPVSNVSLSNFSHDQHGEVNVYGIIEDLDLLEVESLTWNTAPGVKNDPAPELNSTVTTALDMNDLTGVLLTFSGPGETGVRFSTDTSDALADFINSDTDGIITLLVVPSAEGNQLIVRSREHSAGGSLLEGEVMLPPPGPSTEGLIASYGFEGDVLDGSGNANDGVIVGDPIFVEGVVGNALDFNGDDYVDCGNNPLFAMDTNQMTVASWVTIRSAANAWQVIAAKGEYAWRLSNRNLDPSFHFGITWWQAPDTYGVDGATAVGFDEWHHVAGSFDGANINVYLDGVLDGSAPTTEPIGANDKNVLIGNSPFDLVRFWDGLIDEVYIYNRALSDLEIQFLAGK